MTDINARKWCPFLVKDMFITENNGKQTPTGANVPKSDLVENGMTPRITVTGLNNGISGYYDYCGNKPNNYRTFDNCITVSFLGTVFYHKDSVSLDMKVHCLKPLNVILDEYTGEFLVSAIRASLRYSNYADQISSSKLPSFYIMLPTDSKGDPDWVFMKKYMKEIEKIVNNNLNALKSVVAD